VRYHLKRKCAARGCDKKCKIQEQQLREAHERAQLLLDAEPLACRLWDKSFQIFECNAETIRLFQMNSKQEYFERFYDLSPKYQPDGSDSREKKMELLKKAFAEGKCVFEWMHRLPDGTPLPCEVTLVRLKYGEGYVVAGYTRDLREHKRMMGEIEQMIDRVRHANEAKSNFLAGMSHEMRTPLNAIIGLSDLALETEETDGTALEIFEKINNASMMLLGTVNGILDLSKIEAGKAELVPAPYQLADMINDTAVQSSVYIGEKPVTFILNADESLPATLVGDELRIKQIFNNILSNAFKYTNAGTVEMGIDCVREGGAVWMTAYVRDTGVGIRPESIGKLFDGYIQMDKRGSSGITGIGLGLLLTKKVVEMMGGTVEVESEYGKGSTFTVKVRQEYVSDGTIGPDVINKLKNFSYKNEKRRKSKQKRIQLPYARVLVVDDAEGNLDVACGLMKPYGLQVDVARSGQQAVLAIREKKIRYNAIFMDQVMPEMDGIETARVIRSEIGTDYAKNIPIIAFTANAIVGNEDMFLSNGFQAFLSKPVNLDRLDAVIRRWVRDEAQEKWLSLDGVNVAKGIGYFYGDKDIYLGVLRSFAANLPSLLRKITDTGDLNAYAVTLHGIRGSSCGICAEEIEAWAGKLEDAAKSGEHDFVASNNAMFLEKAWSLLDRINEMFLQTDKTVKPKKAAPDRAVLLRLLEACEGYDADAAETAAAELLRYEYETGGELVRRIAENMARFDFAEFTQELAFLRQGIGVQE
jgi:CheY-like chemotaxis protein